MQKARDEIDTIGPLNLQTLIHATSTYGDMWKTTYTNLRCRSPFETF
jgi:hypothetical protein